MLNTAPAYLMEEIGLTGKVRRRFMTNHSDLVRRTVGLVSLRRLNAQGLWNIPLPDGRGSCRRG